MSEREVGPVGRRTPYELVFDQQEIESSLFPRIQAEAAARGVDTRQADRFGFLSLVGDAIRTLVPADPDPEALDQYRSLFLQAYNFWSHGKRLYVVEPGVARLLVESSPALKGWEPRPPHPSLYLQLPANLFWGSIATEAPPEPIDGFWVTEAEDHDPRGRPFRRLEVLGVLGIRRDRAGFSVIPFTAEVGGGIPLDWLHEPGREEGADFENVLPGGELSRLYSVMTTTEALKLVGRILWYLERNPEAVVDESAAERRGEDRPDSPPLTRIPYHRVTLGGS